MKKFLFALLFGLALTVSLPNTQASALEAFTIESFDFHMTVNEDNSYNITETIVMNYTAPRRGFYRDIPINTPYGRRMRITDVSVTGAPFEILYEEGSFSIKIGDPITYAQTRTTYILSYRAIIGEDGNPDFDEVYYDLMGTQWDTYTENFSFTVVMPKAFDRSELSFHRGRYGESGGEGVKYNVSGNTITGSASKGLSPNEGITMGLTLPQGYFTPEKTLGDYLLLLTPPVYVLMLTLGVLLFIRYGKNKKIFPPVEFYPPDGLTPADAGYIIDREASPQDITALILYWADKGFLCIRDDGKGKNLRLVKTGELQSDANIYEKTVFNGIFAHADPTGEVHILQLHNRFYQTMSVAISQLKGRWSTGEKSVYDRSGNPCCAALFLFAFLCTALTVVGAFFHSFFPPASDLLMAALIGSAVFTALTGLGAFSAASLPFKLRKGRAGAVFVTIACAVAVVLLILIAAPDQLLIMLGCFAVSAVLCYLGAMSRYKRTRYGDYIIGRLLGFREFIRVAEVDRIERLIKENPQYFYDILPYALVFNLTNKWADKFRSLEIPAPSWYEGGGRLYSAYTFAALSASMNRSLSTTMTSRPAERSGGSSFGGGGFSGGGSGGGGGRSW